MSVQRSDDGYSSDREESSETQEERLARVERESRERRREERAAARAARRAERSGERSGRRLSFGPDTEERKASGNDSPNAPLPAKREIKLIF